MKIELIKVNCLEDARLIQCAIIIITRYSIISVLLLLSSPFSLTMILIPQFVVHYKCWHLHYPCPIPGPIPALPWFCLKIWMKEAQALWGFRKDCLLLLSLLLFSEISGGTITVVVIITSYYYLGHYYSYFPQSKDEGFDVS